MFLWNSASSPDGDAVNQNDIKTHLANGWSTFFINNKLAFNNGWRSLPRKSPVCINLHNWVFNNFILAARVVTELFARVLGRFSACLLVNNTVCGKLLSSLQLAIVIDDNLKVIRVSFFAAS